jgi:hypothetical protein
MCCEYEIYVNGVLSPLAVGAGIDRDFVYGTASGENTFTVKAVDRAGSEGEAWCLRVQTFSTRTRPAPYMTVARILPPFVLIDPVNPGTPAGPLSIVGVTLVLWTRGTRSARRWIAYAFAVVLPTALALSHRYRQSLRDRRDDVIDVMVGGAVAVTALALARALAGRHDGERRRRAESVTR